MLGQEPRCVLLNNRYVLPLFSERPRLSVSTLEVATNGPQSAN
jgi:hypothetical protein